MPTALVESVMRDAVKNCATDAHKNRKRFFTATNEPRGRSEQERRDVETFFDKINQASNERERDFYTDLYAGYGGDWRDLPQDWDLR